MKLITACITAIASVSSACVSDLDDEQLGQVEQFTKPQCDEWGCGLNSPYIDNFGFHSILQDGEVGEEGLQITKFVQNGIDYKFNVIDGRIIGTKDGYLPLVAFGVAGPGLIGAKLYLALNGVPKYSIRIADAAVRNSWAVQNNSTLRIETYKLEWSGDDVKFQNLCSETTTDDISKFHAVVFEGERIDSKRKTISTEIDNNIVNIGCAGSTLAKMALIAHTEVAKRQGFYTSISERQTALKMFAADYCGTGRAFTVGGQPLQYSDHRNWINAKFISEAEALWTPYGAACLDEPRTLANPTTASAQYFSDVEDQIAKECHRPPPCPQGTSAYNPTAPYHFVSANKQPLIIVPL